MSFIIIENIVSTMKNILSYLLMNRTLIEHANLSVFADQADDYEFFS